VPPYPQPLMVAMPEIEGNKVEPLWTEEEVAAYLRVQPSTVRTWVKSGKIPFVKAGSLNRFRRSEIEDWVESGRLPAEEPEPAAASEPAA